ncbi:hypothetical protein ACFL42_01125 [Candidatus Omnitrophota bacterium]
MFTFITRKRSRVFVRIASIVLMHAFLVTNVSFAVPQEKNPVKEALSEVELVTSPDKIVVPKDFGLVKSKFLGNGKGLVVHIQDAHCNFEAQSNIVKILESFIKNYNIKLISVEGAEGYIDTTWFKAFPDADVRREVATYFMKKGEITGPEFLSITEDYPVKLFGAENKAYYIKNLNAFTTSYKYMEPAKAYFSQIRTILNRLKGYIFTDALKEFDAKMQDHDDKKIKFNDYSRYLMNLAKKYNIEVRDYKNFFKLVNTLRYEDKIDFDIVDKERNSLINDLTKKLNDENAKDTLQELVMKSLTFKVGKISAAEFYNYLRKLSAGNGFVIAEKYPNLSNYVIYVSIYDKIENEKLFHEIDMLTASIKGKMFKNDDQKKLDMLSHHVNTILGLVNIKLLNRDYEYYEEHKDEFEPQEFLDFIQKQGDRFGLAYDIGLPERAILEEAIPKLEDFYAIALKRDRAIVNNTLSAMKGADTRLAVLVSGGFHTEGITEMLEEKGVSYLVVSPNITKEVETPYFQVLTNQRTPFEELLIGATEVKGNMIVPPLIAELIYLLNTDPNRLKRYDNETGYTGSTGTDRANVFRDAWQEGYSFQWVRMTRQSYRENERLQTNPEVLIGKFRDMIIENRDEVEAWIRLMERLGLLNKAEAGKSRKVLAEMFTWLNSERTLQGLARQAAGQSELSALTGIDKRVRRRRSPAGAAPAGAASRVPRRRAYGLPAINAELRNRPVRQVKQVKNVRFVVVEDLAGLVARDNVMDPEIRRILPAGVTLVASPPGGGEPYTAWITPAMMKQIIEEQGEGGLEKLGRMIEGIPEHPDIVLPEGPWTAAILPLSVENELGLPEGTLRIPAQREALPLIRPGREMSRGDLWSRLADYAPIHDMAPGERGPEPVIEVRPEIPTAIAEIALEEGVIPPRVSARVVPPVRPGERPTVIQITPATEQALGQRVDDLKRAIKPTDAEPAPALLTPEDVARLVDLSPDALQRPVAEEVARVVMPEGPTVILIPELLGERMRGLLAEAVPQETIAPAGRPDHEVHVIPEISRVIGRFNIEQAERPAGSRETAPIIAARIVPPAEGTGPTIIQITPALARVLRDHQKPGEGAPDIFQEFVDSVDERTGGRLTEERPGRMLITPIEVERMDRLDIQNGELDLQIRQELAQLVAPPAQEELNKAIGERLDQRAQERQETERTLAAAAPQAAPAQQAVPPTPIVEEIRVGVDGRDYIFRPNPDIAPVIAEIILYTGPGRQIPPVVMRIVPPAEDRQPTVIETEPEVLRRLAELEARSPILQELTGELVGDGRPTIITARQLEEALWIRGRIGDTDDIAAEAVADAALGPGTAVMLPSFYFLGEEAEAPAVGAEPEVAGARRPGFTAVVIVLTEGADSALQDAEEGREAILYPVPAELDGIEVGNTFVVEYPVSIRGLLNRAGAEREAEVAIEIIGEGALAEINIHISQELAQQLDIANRPEIIQQLISQSQESRGRARRSAARRAARARRSPAGITVIPLAQAQEATAQYLGVEGLVATPQAGIGVSSIIKGEMLDSHLILPSDLTVAPVEIAPGIYLFRGINKIDDLQIISNDRLNAITELVIDDEVADSRQAKEVIAYVMNHGYIPPQFDLITHIAESIVPERIINDNQVLTPEVLSAYRKTNPAEYDIATARLIEKIQGEFTGHYGISPDRPDLPKLMYAMQIARIHDTYFPQQSPLVPGRAHYIMTSGHLQKNEQGQDVIDIKQLVEGEGIQYLAKFNEQGEPIDIIAQYLLPGDWTAALPGYVDVFIPLVPGTRFKDISYPVSDDFAQYMTGAIGVETAFSAHPPKEGSRGNVDIVIQAADGEPVFISNPEGRFDGLRLPNLRWVPSLQFPPELLSKADSLEGAYKRFSSARLLFGPTLARHIVSQFKKEEDWAEASARQTAPASLDRPYHRDMIPELRQVRRSPAGALVPAAQRLHIPDVVLPGVPEDIDIGTVDVVVTRPDVTLGRYHTLNDMMPGAMPVLITTPDGAPIARVLVYPSPYSLAEELKDSFGLLPADVAVEFKEGSVDAQIATLEAIEEMIMGRGVGVLDAGLIPAAIERGAFVDLDHVGELLVLALGPETGRALKNELEQIEGEDIGLGREILDPGKILPGLIGPAQIGRAREAFDARKEELAEVARQAHALAKFAAKAISESPSETLDVEAFERILSEYRVSDVQALREAKYIIPTLLGRTDAEALVISEMVYRAMDSRIGQLEDEIAEAAGDAASTPEISGLPVIYMTESAADKIGLPKRMFAQRPVTDALEDVNMKEASVDLEQGAAENIEQIGMAARAVAERVEEAQAPDVSSAAVVPGTDLSIDGPARMKRRSPSGIDRLGDLGPTGDRLGAGGAAAPGTDRLAAAQAAQAGMDAIIVRPAEMYELPEDRLVEFGAEIRGSLSDIVARVLARTGTREDEIVTETIDGQPKAAGEFLEQLFGRINEYLDEISIVRTKPGRMVIRIDMKLCGEQSVSPEELMSNPDAINSVLRHQKDSRLMEALIDRMNGGNISAEGGRGAEFLCQSAVDAVAEIINSGEEVIGVALVLHDETAEELEAVEIDSVLTGQTDEASMAVLKAIRDRAQKDVGRVIVMDLDTVNMDKEPESNASALVQICQLTLEILHRKDMARLSNLIYGITGIRLSTAQVANVIANMIIEMIVDIQKVKMNMAPETYRAARQALEAL